MKTNNFCKRIGFFIAMAIISGCATTLTPAAKNIHPIDHSAAKDCVYLAAVQGSSGWGNLAASQGMQNAKNEAQEQAAKLGATHILWGNIVGGYSPFATGKAYKCQ